MKNIEKKLTETKNVFIAKLCQLKNFNVAKNGQILQEGDFVGYKLVEPTRVCGHRTCYQSCTGKDTYFDFVHGQKDEIFVAKLALLNDKLSDLWVANLIEDKSNLSKSDLTMIEESINSEADFIL